MISFYPGPSKVYDEMSAYMQDAHKQGVLSINHRSDEFMSLCSETISLLKQKLFIPANYTVLFTTSATECWEIIAQSLIQEKSSHIYNGAFGEKWFQYTHRLNAKTESYGFQSDELLNPRKLIFSDSDLICVTQNETSNGTQVSNAIIGGIRKKNSQALVAVDATSSMGGIELQFKNADVWFASVQKCFGLPAGLAIMVCSPSAIQRMNLINERAHYNSLVLMKEMIEKYQTMCTPNVLSIYLLNRVLKKVKTIDAVHEVLTKRTRNWRKFFSKQNTLQLLTKNDRVLSDTVLCMQGNASIIQQIKTEARKAGFVLGEGYGEFKSTTLRIANFPALKDKEIKSLKDFLKKIL